MSVHNLPYFQGAQNSLLETARAPLILFSVADPDTFALVRMNFEIRGAPYQTILGSYKGVEETGFVVPGFMAPDVAKSGILANEESVLRLNELIPAVLDGSRLWVREASLVCLGKSRQVPLGLFRPVAEAVARQADGWTFDPIWRQYYTAVAGPTG